jgi:hypothetical protein
MNRYNFWIFLLMTGAMPFLSQCKRADNVEPTDENELITTVQLTFTEAGGMAPPLTYLYRDVDGDGGNPPSRFDKIALKPATSYLVQISVLDESKTPAEDITKEIASQADEHLFIITANPVSLLTYQYGDKDSRNLPIGLKGTAITGASGTGKLRVQLRHQPPVGGKIVKDGTPGPGSDDISLDFDLQVQ